MKRAVLLLGMLLAACQSPAPMPGEPQGLSEEARELLEADQAFAALSLQAGMAEAFARWVDEDALQLPPGGPPIQGRERIRAGLAAAPSQLLSWEPRYAEVFESADWGWTWGEWQLHEPGVGGRRVGQGKYVYVWKRQADGSWKVRLDIGNSETPRK